MTTPTDHRAQAEIELDHDVAEVWRSLVDDERLAQWLGPDSELSPTPGGELHTSDVVTGEPKRGTVTRVDREQRLTFDWWPVDEPDRVSQVAIELTPSPSGTRVTVTETPTWFGPSASSLSGSASAASSVTATRTGVALAGAAGVWWTWRLAMVAVGGRSLALAW